MNGNRKTLIGVDLEILAERIRESDILILLITNGFIEGAKDPHDIEHVALNLQLQEAAKGEKEVHLICRRPIEKKNFGLLMDMLEGSKLKTIIFVDDKRDLAKASTLIKFMIGGIPRVSGTSEDAWIVE